MTRSPLRNKFLKTKTDENRKAYNNQINYCASLFRREKNSIFNNLDTKKVVDNKRFWQTVKPFFSNKNRIKNKIALIEIKLKLYLVTTLQQKHLTNFLQISSHR